MPSAGTLKHRAHPLRCVVRPLAASRSDHCFGQYRFGNDTRRRGEVSDGPDRCTPQPLSPKRRRRQFHPGRRDGLRGRLVRRGRRAAAASTAAAGQRSPPERQQRLPAQRQRLGLRPAGAAPGPAVTHVTATAADATSRCAPADDVTASPTGPAAASPAGPVAPAQPGQPAAAPPADDAAAVPGAPADVTAATAGATTSGRAAADHAAAVPGAAAHGAAAAARAAADAAQAARAAVAQLARSPVPDDGAAAPPRAQAVH